MPSRAAPPLPAPFVARIRRHAVVSDADLRRLARRLRPCSLAKGAWFGRAGGAIPDLALVARGALHTFATDARGALHTFQFALEGDWTGDLRSFQDGGPARFSIRALEPSEIWLLSAPDFAQLLAQAPAFERLFRILFQLAYVEAQDRVVAAMQRTAGQRYEDFLRRFRGAAGRLPGRHIASYLGIAPETLSRIRARRGAAAVS